MLAFVISIHCIRCSVSVRKTNLTYVIDCQRRNTHARNQNDFKQIGLGCNVAKRMNVVASAATTITKSLEKRIRLFQFERKENEMKNNINLNDTDLSV